MQTDELRELRNAFSSFITGVTVVTTREPDGTPRGFTANSFTSVSLDPPLLLVCIGRSADSYPVFTGADGFAVNILSGSQVETSGLFASKRADKFDQAHWHPGAAGYPILDDVCTWFECDMHSVREIGDHAILLGQVTAFDYNDQTGLGFVRGGYIDLSLEQKAVRAVSNRPDITVGAIVDWNGAVLLEQDEGSGLWRLPVSGREGRPGSVGNLVAGLESRHVEATVTSLYAVFENESDGKQSIYYRALGHPGSDPQRFLRPDDIPWDRLESEPIRTMLRRYFDEMREQRFGIYFGSDRTGSIKFVSDS